MTSKSNHSPVAPPVSSAGFSPGKTAGEFDPLAALIAQSDLAVDLMLSIEADPQRQAALLEIAEQSTRAAAALYAHQRATGGPLSSGE